MNVEPSTLNLDEMNIDPTQAKVMKDSADFEMSKKLQGGE